MSDKIEALREKAEGLDALLCERNLYKGKYRALLKLIIKTRGKLVQVTDHIEDEGDRAYFGSTNHADDLKELYHEMMGWIWDATDETNRMKSDPYADIRKQRARAEKAEAELSRLRSSNEAMRKALEQIRDVDFEDAKELQYLNAKATIIERLSSIARAALSSLKEEEAR